MADQWCHKHHALLPCGNCMLNRLLYFQWGEEHLEDNKPEVVPGGANRVPVKADYSQLSHHALRLMADTQGEGNVTYGYGNWQKGLPLSNLLSHALAHILAFQNGDVSENHLGHALWNLEKAAHFMVERPDLIDIVPLRKALGLGTTNDTKA